MWCLLDPALLLCLFNCGGCSLLRYRHGVMGRRAPWRWRWRSAGDQAGACWYLVHHMFGLLVSRPEGKVSCRPGPVQGSELALSDGFCRRQSASGRRCSRRRFTFQLQAVAAGMFVPCFGGIVSCVLGPALRWCFSGGGWCSLLQCRPGAMSRQVPWRWRWRSAGDQAGACCALGSG